MNQLWTLLKKKQNTDSNLDSLSGPETLCFQRAARDACTAGERITHWAARNSLFQMMQFYSKV